MFKRRYKLYFKNVPKIDMFDEDIDPRTSYKAIYYNSHPTPKVLAECRNKYGLDRNGYVNYVVHQQTFQDMLTILIWHIILDIQGKVLIYIGTNQAIEFVYNWIEENFPQLKGKVGIFTSISEKSTKNEELDKKIILSTTKSCGAAMDIAGLEETIVLAEPFKSPIIAKQTLGRTRAENTSYIELVDKGFFHIKKWADSKGPIFQKYATSYTTEAYNDFTIRQLVDKVEYEKTHGIEAIRYLDDKDKFK